MATYLELKEQAERLLAQAEEMREKEIADAIADIKEKMRLYGLTAEDLGLGRAGSGGGRAPRGKAAASPIKYRGPNGETWSGGRLTACAREETPEGTILKAGANPRGMQTYAVGR